MKCLRKTYKNETYSQRQRYIKQYNRQYRKSQSPYSRRHRTCARALDFLMFLSLNDMAYYNAWARISHQWPDKKRWQ